MTSKGCSAKKTSKNGSFFCEALIFREFFSGTAAFSGFFLRGGDFYPKCCSVRRRSDAGVALKGRKSLDLESNFFAEKATVPQINLPKNKGSAKI